MIGFGDFSDLSFSSQAVADPQNNRGLLDSLAKGGTDLARLPVDLFDENKRDAAGALFKATERKQLFVDSSTARGTAANFDMHAQFDLFVDRVQKVTGIRLDNPLARVSAEWASGGGRDFIAGPFGIQPPEDFTAFRKARIDDFFNRVRDLKTQHAGKLDDIPDAADQAGALATARSADSSFRQEWQRTDGNAIMDGIAMLGGGMYGSRTDPLAWASLALPAGGVAATAAGRIVNAVIVQGAGNAAFSAAAQPFVQSWKAEAGLDSGWREAAKDVAFAGLIGGAAGGAMQGVGEAIKRLARGTGTVADLETVVRAQGRELDPESRAILPLAQQADAADAAMLKSIEGVPEPQARAIAADALVHIAEPTAPLPLGRRYFDLTVDDTAARAATRAAQSADEAIDALRANGAMLSALNSPDPVLRDMGHVSSLSGEALSVQRTHGVPIDQAAIVHAMTDSAAEQSKFMSLLAAQRPQTVNEARVAITAQIAADKAIDAATARAWAPKAFPYNRTPTLLEMIAWRGGLQPSPDVAQIVDKLRPFYPGIGPLISKKGMSLDGARELATQFGYLHDAAQFADNVMSTSTVNDVLELVRREIAGDKVLPYGADAPFWTKERNAEVHDYFAGGTHSAKQERAIMNRMERDNLNPHVAELTLQHEKAVADFLRKDGAGFGLPRDKEAEALAAQIMLNDNVADVALAYESAMIRLAEQPGPGKSGATSNDIPFDTVSVDARPAPQAGETVRPAGVDGISARPESETGTARGDARGAGQADRGAAIPVATRDRLDALNAVPELIDGQWQLVGRDTADAVMPRVQHLADVVKACKA